MCLFSISYSVRCGTILGRIKTSYHKMPSFSTSNLFPSVSMRKWTLSRTSRCTNSSISGATLAQTSDMRRRRSSTVVGVVAYTCCLCNHTGISQLESGQVNLETTYRNQRTRLFVAGVNPPGTANDIFCTGVFCEMIFHDLHIVYSFLKSSRVLRYEFPWFACSVLFSKDYQYNNAQRGVWPEVLSIRNYNWYHCAAMRACFSPETKSFLLSVKFRGIAKLRTNK